MAFTVTTDLTDIDTAESATPWTTGSLDPAKFVQGSNSIGWYASKNTRSVNGVSSKSISHSAGDHLYWWNASDVVALAEAQTTGTTTASGVTIRVTLSDSAYREWHVAGGDTWDGGWRCFVVDLSHTGTHLYASGGTWSTANNITDVDIYIDLSNSGNIRNVPANNYADAIRVGTGITAYNTSAADASFDLADIAANDNLVANKRGVLEVKDGVIFAQGRVTIGATATNHTDFDSQDETFVFSLRDGTDGFGLVSDDLYEMNFVGNSTGTDQDINFGVKVGTGDTATGRSGSTIQGQGAVRWKMDWNDADIHSFTMYGSTIRGAYDGTGVIGVQAGLPVTTHEVIGNTFDACGQIDLQDAVVRNCNFLNSQETGTTFGALLWDESDIDIKNVLMVNNTNAIEIRDGDLTTDMTITGFTFAGNTFDIRYEDTVDDFDCNVVDSTTPSISNPAAGTLTAVIAPVTTTITIKDNDTAVAVVGAWVYLEASDGTGPLQYQVASTSWSRSGTVATVGWAAAHNLVVGQKVLIEPNSGSADASAYGVKTVATVPTTTSITYAMTDAGATTGVTVDATGVLISEATVAGGIANDTRSLSASQPVTGWARQGTRLKDGYFSTSDFETASIETPDNTASDITGDIEIIALIRPTSTNAQNGIFGKGDTVGNERAYYFKTNTGTTRSVLRFGFSTDGTAQTFASSTAELPASYTTTDFMWVRVTFDVDNGASNSDLKFWYSTDNVRTDPQSVSWTQLGTTVNSGSTQSINNSAEPVTLGYTPWDTGNGFDGDIAFAGVWSGLGGGTLGSAIDLREDTVPYIDGQSNVWLQEGSGGTHTEPTGIYKQSNITGSVSNTDGLALTIPVISDE